MDESLEIKLLRMQLEAAEQRYQCEIDLLRNELRMTEKLLLLRIETEAKVAELWRPQLV